MLHCNISHIWALNRRVSTHFLCTAAFSSGVPLTLFDPFRGEARRLHAVAGPVDQELKTVAPATLKLPGGAKRYAGRIMGQQAIWEG